MPRVFERLFGSITGAVERSVDLFAEFGEPLVDVPLVFSPVVPGGWCLRSGSIHEMHHRCQWRIARAALARSGLGPFRRDKATQAGRDATVPQAVVEFSGEALEVSAHSVRRRGRSAPFFQFDLGRGCSTEPSEIPLSDSPGQGGETRATLPSTVVWFKCDNRGQPHEMLAKPPTLVQLLLPLGLCLLQPNFLLLPW